MSYSPVTSAIVVGSGPAGLCSAIMLVQRGVSHVKLYDRLSEPPFPNSTLWEDLNSDRAYNIGINGRGQAALRRFGVMSKIESYATTVVGRKDWTPESSVDEPRELIFGEQKSYLTKCIQRDRLTACLVEVVREMYSDKIELLFDVECKDVTWITNELNKETCVLTLRDNRDGKVNEWTDTTEFLVGADGAQSAVRNAMEFSQENGFRHTKFEDKNVRVYRTIPLHFPKDSKTWRKDVNYSARTKSDVNLDALPTKEGPYVGVVLFRPWDTRVTDMTTAAEARAFFESVFPMFAPFIEDGDLETFAKKKPSALPKFSYSGPVLHKGHTTCLVGDSIHTVKPYFGMGVNSAFEDIVVLEKALEENNNDVGKAVKSYSRYRARDTKALVHMSKKLDGGFFAFVLPLIIDTVLNNIAPWLFSPNSISSLQNEKKTFTQIQSRKRMDRIVQTVLGLTSLAIAFKALQALLRFVLSVAKNRLLSIR